jgi:hypothetical protein
MPLGPSSTPKTRPSAVAAAIPARIAPAVTADAQHDGDGDPAERDQGRTRREVAEADPRRRVVEDDAALPQADERDEEADADADRQLERLGHGPHDRPAGARQDEHQRQQPLDDHARHRHGPVELPPQDEVERDDRVEPETRGQGERQVGEQPHGGRRDRRGERRRDGHRVERHAGGRQDRGVDEQDVAHRQERREPSQELGPQIGPSFGEAEAPLQEDARAGSASLWKEALGHTLIVPSSAAHHPPEAALWPSGRPELYDRSEAMAATEAITVECPKCGDHFKDWWRPCANLESDPDLADPGYLDCAATATCPHCGKTIRLGVLTADGDVWRRH